MKKIILTLLLYSCENIIESEILTGCTLPGACNYIPGATNDDNSIDIVSIASYDNYHCDQIVRAFHNGKHVMAEKPICLNRNEMEKIIDAQERSNNL